MAYFTSLWQARIIEKYRLEYENEKFNSLLISNTEIPRKPMMQRWRIYGHYTKRRMTGRLKKWFPDGSSVSNLYYYLKTDQTFPNFVLKSIIGFCGGIVLTYLCFMFFVFQLSISLIHATFMSSVIGVLLTLGLAFSFRIRCLVFLLIPQFFSRIGRYTLMCYALILILTGPATNTLKNSEVLSESMACSQEQIKSSARQITESMKTPFNSMKDSIKLMVDKIKRVTSKLNDFVSKIGILTTSIGDEIQSSLNWLIDVVNVCNRKYGSPYDYCIKTVDRGLEACKKSLSADLAWICNASVKSACLSVKPYDSICVVADYATTSFAATLKRKLATFTNRIYEESFIDIEMHHTHIFSSNATVTANQVAAGIVTEMRNRADPLLTWLSWSSCVTSLFLLLIIFRAKYYQQMYETRSRFDNRYVTKELRELDFKRYQEGRETVLPLNRRERAKYISIMSYRLIATEKVYLTRSVVFMAITTFKLLIHMVADYSLYWVLMTIRYHGRFQSQIPPGPSDGGVHISGTGFVKNIIQSLFHSMTTPLLFKTPSPVTCLPNPYPPDFKRYMQIAVLIILLWFCALFEPYGLRLRHVIMGHYRPERAKSRAVWLYNHILRTRGSFMKLARRKLHREYKYSIQKDMTFRHLINSYIPWWCLKYILGSLPNEPHCLLCNTFEDIKDGDTKLKSCETIRCPGIYCLSCFSDIGKLCTICLSPADYGDMSDVSFENGSSDESSDDGKDNINLKLLKNNERINDNERTKLIKKSSVTRKTQLQKRNREGGQYEACNTFTNDNKSYNNRRLGNVKKEDTDKKSDTQLRTLDCFINKIYNGKEIKKKSLEDGSKYCKLRFKFTNLIKLKRKIQIKETAGWRFLLSLFATFFQYSKLANVYKFSSSVYDIQTSAKSIKVFKKRDTNKLYNNILNQGKKNNRSNELINKNVNKRPSFNLLYTRKTKSPNPKIIEFCLTTNLKNGIDNSNNKEVNKDDNVKKKRKNKKCSDKVPNKGKSNVEKNQCCRGVKEIRKICSTCFFTIKRQVTPSKELLHSFKKKKYPQSTSKLNFKRKKKEKHVHEKKNKATVENENARNYRISTYLFDNSWIRVKSAKDPKTDKYTRENALSDLAKLRIEAIREQAKEITLLKIIRKKHLPRTKKCQCPFKECICQGNLKNTCMDCHKCLLTKLDKIRQSCDKVCCHSKTDLNTHSKKVTKTTNNLSPRNMPTKGRGDQNITRRMNYYSSLGNSDFEHDHANVKVDESGCQNNLSAEKISEPSNEKSHMSRCSKGIKFDFDKFSTSLKSLKIKDIKVGISERFLHLRIRNPLPLMKDFYATIIETSNKEKRKVKHNNTITEEKGVTVMPTVNNCSCQYNQDIKNLEDRATQINPKEYNLRIHTNTIERKHDRKTEVKTCTCTCATQNTNMADKNLSCMQINSSAQEFGDNANILQKTVTEEIESTDSLYSLSEDTRTDTTVCSRVEINYEEQHVKNKIKRKINVVTKANQSTTTEKAKLCDVSTITNDWWSPIVERKQEKEHLCRKIIRKKRPNTKNDRSVSTDGKIVTFMSRAQIIPMGTKDILSPSRYLLESQRYYNELFSSEIYSPRIYPVLFKKYKYRGKHVSSRDSMSTIRKENRTRSGCKPKRLDKRGGSFKARVGKTRSNESSFKY